MRFQRFYQLIFRCGWWKTLMNSKQFCTLMPYDMSLNKKSLQENQQNLGVGTNSGKVHNSWTEVHTCIHWTGSSSRTQGQECRVLAPSNSPAAPEGPRVCNAVWTLAPVQRYKNKFCFLNDNCDEIFEGKVEKITAKNVGEKNQTKLLIFNHYHPQDSLEINLLSLPSCCFQFLYCLVICN